VYAGGGGAGTRVGTAVATGVGATVGSGVGAKVGTGVGSGVATGVGSGVGTGVDSGVTTAGLLKPLDVEAVDAVALAPQPARSTPAVTVSEARMILSPGIVSLQRTSSRVAARRSPGTSVSVSRPRTYGDRSIDPGLRLQRSGDGSRAAQRAAVTRDVFLHF
jgi:hypothetical protein